MANLPANNAGASSNTVVSPDISGKSGSSGASSAGKAKPKKRQAGSGFDKKPGRRDLKEYPLTEGEMNELSAIGIIATLLFSLASGLLIFAIDVSQNLAFAGPVPQAAIVYWGTLRLVAAFLSPVMAIIGILLMYRGHTRLAKIKGETSHGD